jgi:ribose transport system permease protein
MRRSQRLAVRLSRVATKGQPLIPYLILLSLCGLLVSQQPSVLDIGEFNVIVAETLALVWVALAQNFVILSGGIDLSVGGIVSLTTALAATRLMGAGPLLLPTLAGIAVIGLGIGCVNGALVAFTRIQPFIVTLATWSITGGIAFLVLPTSGGSVPESVTQFGNGHVGPLAVPVWLLVATIFAWMLLARTRFGVMAKAIGSRREAARLSGVPVNWVFVGVYGTSGLFSSLAGLYLVTQIASGSPTAGNEFILTSVAATVIGGASLAGGRAPWGGAIAGAFTLTLIGSVIFALGVTQGWQIVAVGATLVGAVLLYSLSSRISGWRGGLA